MLNERHAQESRDRPHGKRRRSSLWHEDAVCQGYQSDDYQDRPSYSFALNGHNLPRIYDRYMQRAFFPVQHQHRQNKVES